MTSNLIRDNFSRAGFIEAVEGLHDDLRFEFRPMLPEALEALDLYRAQNVTDVRKVMARARREVTERLTSWSEENAKGDSEPISVDTLALLHPALWEKLFAVICGRRPVDFDPMSPPSKPQGDLTEQLGN